MKIAIVEDEAVWRDKVQTIIEKYCSDKIFHFKSIPIVVEKNL